MKKILKQSARDFSEKISHAQDPEACEDFASLCKQLAEMQVEHAKKEHWHVLAVALVCQKRKISIADLVMEDHYDDWWWSTNKAEDAESIFSQIYQTIEPTQEELSSIKYVLGTFVPERRHDRPGRRQKKSRS